MIDFNKLLNLISSLTDSGSHNESWGFVNISGNYEALTLNQIDGIYDYLKSCGHEGILSLKLDNDNVSSLDLKDYIEQNSLFENWQLNINKQALFEKEEIMFFCFQKELEKWISLLKPFDPENPFHKFSFLKIIVSGLSYPIIGYSFKIINANEEEDFSKDTKGLPQKEKISQIVHSIPGKNVINPLSFLFHNDRNSDLEQKLRRLSCMSLAATIINEFYSPEEIIVDGIRRVKLSLSKSTDTFPLELNENLIELVKWIYDDKVVTRQKLFLDRLTLELNEQESLIKSLSNTLNSALDQAKQRYNFVILERKDKYISELKDLLKDIRGQSDLYSQKIRTLLNNLLRDVLAAFILIGFTVFTKFTDNIFLDKESLLQYVFNALALYYVASIIFQTIVDVTDIQVSKKEMFYWKNATKELLPEKDFTIHINTSLKSRRISLRVIYPLLILLYLFIAFECYKFPQYFHQFYNQKNQKENTNDTLHKRQAPAGRSPQSRK